MSDTPEALPGGWTPEETAAGLAMYTHRLMVWPDDPSARQMRDVAYVGTRPGGVLFTRSPGWRPLRLEWVRTHPWCMACGGRKQLEVHHKKPFHLFPELELDRSNLITLCTGSRGINCHFVFGHGLDWVRYTENVDGLAATYWTALAHLQPEKSNEELTRDLLAAVERLGATRLR